ncbi:MAG TPA: hypothetical protein VGX96_06995 [Candidatus Elarobacter sp.]|jgi:hypothetical protein|nr:hypothetical protein [Candidatus Elarobacter sp.]
MKAIAKRLASAASIALAAATPVLTPSSSVGVVLQTGLGNSGCVASGILLGIGIFTGQPEIVGYALFGAYANC